MRGHIKAIARASMAAGATVALALSMVGSFVGPVQALDESTLGTNFITDFIDLPTGDPRSIAAAIINVFLGFLALIALVIVLLGGFRWMTSQGAEEKVDEAKKMLSAGVIGLVIVISAWAIANFLVTQLIDVTNEVR
ncbi:MAG: pilin [bacterium]|nr:pilin [bacterium]